MSWKMFQRFVLILSYLHQGLSVSSQMIFDQNSVWFVSCILVKLLYYVISFGTSLQAECLTSRGPRSPYWISGRQNCIRELTSILTSWLPKINSVVLFYTFNILLRLCCKRLVEVAITPKSLWTTLALAYYNAKRNCSSKFVFLFIYLFDLCLFNDAVCSTDSVVSIDRMIN